MLCNINLSVEKNSKDERIEPGQHIKKGSYIHHTSGQILPNRDNHPLALFVAKDSIAYTYYIHHQRSVNNSTVPSFIYFLEKLMECQSVQCLQCK